MRAATRKYTFEESAVVGDLKFWGFHNGKLLAWHGYPAEETVKRFLDGGGSSGFAHRILMRDLSRSVASRFWPINGRILRLPEHLRAAVIARYCVPPKEENGTVVYHTRSELAEALHITEHEYRKRLREAKNMYRAMLFTVDAKIVGVYSPESV